MVGYRRDRCSVSQMMAGTERESETYEKNIMRGQEDGKTTIKNKKMDLHITDVDNVYVRVCLVYRNKGLCCGE